MFACMEAASTLRQFPSAAMSFPVRALVWGSLCLGLMQQNVPALRSARRIYTESSESQHDGHEPACSG